MTSRVERMGKLSPAKRRLLVERLAKKRATEDPEAVTRRSYGNGPLPLSYGQERLWFLQQLHPDSAGYLLPSVVSLAGELNVAALQLALATIVRRHETLRAVFKSTAKGPVQFISPEPGVAMPLVSLAALAAGDRESLVLSLARSAAARPFDLSQGPPVRFLLIRLAENRHVMVRVAHHVASDAWSDDIYFRELVATYEAFSKGERASLPELHLRYGDYILWQRERVESGAYKDQLAYWCRQLAGTMPEIALPTDRPRPSTDRFEANLYYSGMSAELAARTRTFCRDHGVTKFMLFLAVFDALLYRWCGVGDLSVGVPVANRSRSEIENLVGFFLNTLVLRVKLEGNSTFHDLLEQVEKTTLEARANQDVPFEQVVKELHPERVQGLAPLFQIFFALRENLTTTVKLPGLELSVVDIGVVATQGDMTFVVEERDEDSVFSLGYRVDLFDGSTMQRLLRYFENVLDGALRSPEAMVDELPLLRAQERHQLMVEWNDTGRDPTWEGGLLVHEVFASQAERTPEEEAVIFAGQGVCYRELNQRADQLARRLRALGVGPEVVVGLCVGRSPDLLVGVLGILKAGGAYLPLDPSYPAERLAFMLADSQAPVLVCEEQWTALFPGAGVEVVLVEDEDEDEDEDEEKADGCRPENLAYVIYTSGSTGKPKGVQIRHRALLNFLASMAVRPGLGTGDVLVAVTTLSFDIAALELFLPLLVGARVVLASAEEAADGAALVGLLRRCGATVMQATPATWQLLLAAGWDGRPALRVLCGGEALPAELARQLRARGAELWNLYGPTETTIWSLVERLSEQRVLIGRPIANTRLRVLDRRLRPVPIGVPGELWLGGEGMARGYLARPALTAERFVPEPCAESEGGRLYRTGDLARVLPDGRLDFLGRLDHQVKLRGHRIELGEIETVLARHPGVREAVVVVRDERLVAYLTATDTEPPAVETLRRYLGERLPDYMVPALYVTLESFPLTPNRKVDRRALPAPEGTREGFETAYVPPATDLEQSLAEIWKEVLGLERVGLEDSFFDLGGHSLLLAQVRVRVEKLTGREVALMELFRHPNIRSLVAWLSGEEGAQEKDSGTPAVVRRQRPGREIAIIGMSARFPGASSVDEFWHNLCGGIESMRALSDEELTAAGVDRAVFNAADYVRVSADVRDPDRFDAAFFGFNPREAEILDPQHRVLLECAWEALENAGYDPTRHPGAIGVFAGAGMSRYALNVFTHRELVISVGMATLVFSVGQDFLAPRVSYKLDLRGPSVVVQTACSTSLVAAHLAGQALNEGECDMALAGGVTLLEHPPRGYQYLEGGIQSSDGHCRTFDAAAQGMVSSSGAGVVVLKRLADAVADGDVIHAVIRGSAVNNDGALKIGYTAPSEEGQAAVIRTAQRAAGVDPETIGYVEAHGTATALGDPIEVAALTRVFRERTERRGFCALGSVKTNIGHADTAAGVAGLIKTVLALEHGLLPPSLHFETPNPEIDFESSPFRVVTELCRWETDGALRRAGVSSFGIGGTNAHLVLEEAPPAAPSGPSRQWQLVVLSAATASALEAVTERLAAHLQASPETHLADVAFTCQVGRRRLPHRRFLVCRDGAEAAQVLAAGAESERVHDADEERSERSVVFLLSGLGDHYAGMGRELYATEPTFRAEVDRCCERLAPVLGRDLREVLYPPPEEPPPEEPSGMDLRALLGRVARPAAPQPLDETRLAQPAVFVVQVALARLLREWGVVPRALLGYSLGEYTAAHLAGVLSLEDALDLVAARARLIATVPPGGMLAVPLPAAQVEPLLGEELSLAATNGPEVSVVAGPEEAIDRFAERLRADGQVCQRLRTRHAFHSHMLRPIAAEFGARVREVELRPPQLPYLSNVTGTWIRPQEATDPDYWVRHLCRPVRFAEGLSELMTDAGPILLEIGPGQALATSARQHPERPAGKMVLASLRDERERQSDQAFLLHTLGRLWLAGVEVDWGGFARHEKRRRVVLPGYPFERQRFFIEPSVELALGPVGARKADLGDWFYLPSWKRSLPPPAPAAGRAGRWLVFADDEGLAEQVARLLGATGGEVTLVRAGAELNRRGVGLWEIDPERPEHYQNLLERLVAEQGPPEQVVHFRSFTRTDAAASFARRFAAAQARGLYSLVWLTQALVKVVFADRVTLTVVTNGLQDVERDDVPAPEKATLLGALRVIPQEYGHVSCRNVDVVPPAAGGGQEELAALVAAELTAGGAEPVVAYRGSSRWVESFEPVHLEAPPEAVGLRRQGVYLLTGGLGNIGLALAEFLARTVEARLVLTARTPLPPPAAWEEQVSDPATPAPLRDRITRLRALEAAGAEVLVVAADVADRAGMQAAVDQARERFGALHGVFHLAGAFRADAFDTIEVTDPELCRRQFRPKVEGLHVLAEVIEPLALDFCVLFSSLSVVLGGLGFSAYAAANAFMDAFARARQRRGGVAWISIDWDGWAFGEVQGFGRTLAQFRMAPDEALEALRRVLGLRGVPQIVVSTGDLDARIATWTAAPGGEAEAPGRGLSVKQRPELSQAYVAPTNETEETIAGIWQSLLGVEEVGIHDDFLELGGDSLIGVQLIARLRENFRVQLSVQQVFEAPTVATLAALVASGDEQEDLSQLENLLREVEQMSQDEVQDELQRPRPMEA